MCARIFDEGFPLQPQPIREGDLDRVLDRLDRMSDREFRGLQLQLVSRYRLNEDEQEPIAVALNRKNRAEVGASPARRRADDILIMLDHIHDPFIR
jgi:hypothetical protein